MAQGNNDMSKIVLMEQSRQSKLLKEIKQRHYKNGPDGAEICDLSIKRQEF